ncbi:hypothetical protein Q0Z83_071480 [Actinoplanes sichuanensis]|nr:hypothetical protein Q0Z83_071480 [Actinoplanes sichuanensis]
MGSRRSTDQEITSHAAPVNIRKPHMLPCLTVEGEDPDHNMRPPDDAVPAMTASGAARGPGFAQIARFTVAFSARNATVIGV